MFAGKMPYLAIWVGTAEYKMVNVGNLLRGTESYILARGFEYPVRNDIISKKVNMNEIDRSRTIKIISLEHDINAIKYYRGSLKDDLKNKETELEELMEEGYGIKSNMNKREKEFYKEEVKTAVVFIGLIVLLVVILIIL